jgi:chemotaxis signal transduction protein
MSQDETPRGQGDSALSPETPSTTSSSRADEPQTVLKERARKLAARELETVSQDTFAEIIVVQRSGVKLGAPIHNAKEVRSVELSRVPGATSIVCGVFQIRGRTCGLVDLGSYFGKPEPLAHQSRVLVAVLETSAGEIGVLIDEVLGPRTVLVEEIDGGLGESALGFVSAVTHDVVHILDLDRLVSTRELHL